MGRIRADKGLFPKAIHAAATAEERISRSEQKQNRTAATSPQPVPTIGRTSVSSVMRELP